MTEEQLLAGDDAIHGESAYTFSSEAQEHLLPSLGTKVDDGVVGHGVTMGHDPHQHPEKSSGGGSGEIKDD